MPEIFEQFGKYLLLEKLATGGMAEVFLARSSAAGGINKFVAIKRILPQYAESPEFIDMFKDEAKIAVNLSHGNIVSIYDFGVQNSTFYLVMDYVEGRNLRQILNKLKKSNHRLSIDQVVYIIKEVAAGLDHAHRCLDGSTGKPLNITHRDMSPQNVMISFEAEVKIVDFGIAKAESQIETTRAGTLKGKFGYMSPEQAEGHPVDLRTDIFSLGIVLWELLANDRLFVASNEINTLRKIRDCQVPSLRKINPNIPQELERIAMKSLARDRNLRYQTAAAMHRDLNRFLNRHYPEFSPHDFSQFIKTQFHEEIYQNRQRQIEYSKIAHNPNDQVSLPSVSRAEVKAQTSSGMIGQNTNSYVSGSPQDESQTKSPPNQSVSGINSAPVSDPIWNISFTSNPSIVNPDAPTPAPKIPNQPDGAIPSLKIPNIAQSNLNQDQGQVTETGRRPNPMEPVQPQFDPSALSKELNRVKSPLESGHPYNPDERSLSGVSNRSRNFTRSDIYVVDPSGRSFFKTPVGFVASLAFGILALYILLAKVATSSMLPVITKLDPYFRPLHNLVGISDGSKTSGSQTPVDGSQSSTSPTKQAKPEESDPIKTDVINPPPTMSAAPMPAPTPVIPKNPDENSEQTEPEPLRPGEPRETLLVTSTPSGAEVLVNGRPTGTLTPSRVEVPSTREFNITLRRMGFLDYRRDSLKKSELGNRFSGTLQPALVGYLDIDVVPPQNIRVYVNGRHLVGEHLPITGYAVPAESPITIKAEDPVLKQSVQQVVKVQKDRRLQVILDMRRGSKSDRQPSRSR